MSEQSYFEQFVGDVDRLPTYCVSCYGEVSRFDTFREAYIKQQSYPSDCYPTLYVIEQ